MKKEIAPELYNYNKFPGPSFARVGDKVVAESIELDLLEDYREAFDQTAFGQRFSPIMLKFDYIVGDWGNEQLRLKGFYKDDKAVKSDIKISRLDDYLTEFCNFGCAYFVLGNNQPQELAVEMEERPSRKRRNRSNRKNQRSFTVKEKNEKNTPRIQKQQKPERSKKQSKKKNHGESQEAKRGFVIRQK
ncbi:DUF1027 domain-containing protein [Streptococcus sp. zg-86]|uniref:DUF1027 domain-containing protein n=1 Tax=Streptococcus zhangguiae TaxID=2664091 RepID=A0A6I4RGG0_9STRE|nr:MULTISPECIES: YutD-like domain-containing protein [unclassified Streptococcus]MTB64477.1 DUF1027 domain-containing protein [Streptococcus sp. zg-86]MTB90833.1 DUF1027 domain-containing protein [Streptococcus sp. zg-36]MWV56464.1 DUF1027 domain-containing protein [Streptococcus sp. zg-70]QTH47329.1 DUF1027 domain-containing protein [Streptococcus sp. zg-86]